MLFPEAEMLELWLDLMLPSVVGSAPVGSRHLKEESPKTSTTCPLPSLYHGWWERRKAELSFQAGTAHGLTVPSVQSRGDFVGNAESFQLHH